MQHGYFLPAHHGFPSCSAQTYGQVLYQNHINHFNMNSLPGLGDSTSGSSLAASERWKSFGRYGTGNRAITNVPSSHPNIPAMLHGQGQQFPTSRSLVNDMLNPSMLHPAKYYGDPRAGSQLPQQLLQSLSQFSQQRFSKQGWVCEVPSASHAQKKSTSRYQPPGSVPQSWSSIYNGALGYGSGLFPHSLHDSLPAQHLSYNERAAQLYSKRMSAETFTGAKHHDNPNQSSDSMQFPLSVEYDHARLQSSLPRATPLPSSESVTELYHNRVTAETLNDARQQNSNTNKAAGSIPYSISEEYDHRQAQPLVLPSGQCQQNGHEVFSVEYQQKSMERPGHPCDQTFNETSNSQEASSGSVLGNRFYSKVAPKAKKAKSKYSSRLPKKQRKSRCDLGSGISQDQGRRSEYCFQASQTVYPVKHSSMVNGAQNTGVGSTSTNKRKSEDFLVHMLRKLCSSAENSSTNSRSLFGSTLYSSSADELSQTSHVYRLAGEESQEGRTNRSGNSHCGVGGSQWAQTGRGASGEKCHPAMNTEDRTMLQNVGPLLQELLVKNKPRLYERLYLTVKSSPILQTLIDKESSRSRKHLYPKIKRLLDILNKLNNRLASDNTNISNQTQPSSMNNSTDERLVPTGTQSLQKCQSARCPIICDLHNPLRFPVHHEEDTLSASDPSLTPVQQKQSENCRSDKSDELVRDVDIMKRTYESSGAQELDSQQINLREKLPEVSGLDHVNPHSALKHSVSDIQLAETALKHSESDTQLTDHTSVVLPFDKYLHTIKTSAGLGGGSSPASLGKKSLDICHTCLACERTFSSSSRLEEHLFARLQSNTSNSVSVDRKRDLFQDDGMDSEHPVHLKPEPTEQATSFPTGNEQVAVANETTGNCVKFDLTNETPFPVCRLYDPESEENCQELNVQNEGKQTFQVDVGCQDTVSAKQVLVSPVSKREETPIQPRPAFDSRKLLTEKTKGEHDCFVISEHFVDIENHVFPSSPQNFQESKTSEFSHSKVSAPKMTGTSKTKTGLTKGKLKLSGRPNSHLRLYGQTTIQETCQSSYTKKIGESAHCPDKTLVSKTPVLDTLKTAADGTMRIKPARKEKSEQQRAEGQCSYPVKCAVEEIRSADRESSSSPADTQEPRWEITETAGSDILPFSAKKSCLKKHKSNIISDRNDHSMKKLNRPYKPVSAVHKNRNTVAASVSGEKRKFSSSKQQLDTKDNSKMRSVEIFKDRHVVFPIKHITQANSTQGSPRTNRTLNPKKRKVEHIYESKAQCGHEVMDMDHIPSKKSKVDGEDKCVYVDDLEERKRDVKCSDALNSSRKKNCSPNLCGIKVQNSISASSKSDDPKTDHKIDSNRRVATSSKAKKIVNSLKNLFKNNLHLQSHCMRQGKAGAKDATCVKDWIQECRHKTLREILETQHVGNESRNETRWLKDNAESSMSDTAPSWKKNTNTNDPENTIGICEHKGCTNESVNSSLEPVADSVQVCSDHRLKDSVSSVSDDKSCSRSVNDNSLSSLPGDRSSAQGVNSVSCLSSSKSLSQGVKDNSVNSLSGDRSSNQDMDNSVNRVPGKKSSNENKNDNKDFVFCIKCMTMFTKRLVYNEHGCCQKNQNAKESNEEEMDNVESEQDCTDFGKATLDHEHKYDAAKINPSICVELDNDSGLSDTVCASDAEYNQKQKSTHYKLKRLPKVGKEKNRKRMTSSQKKKPMRLSSKIDKTNASAHALFKCEHCDQNYSSRGGLLFHWQAVHRKSIA